MRFQVDVVNGLFTGPFTTQSTDPPDNPVSLLEFYQGSDLHTPFDSGLIPCSGEGLISYRKAFGFEQFILQRPAGKYLVKWGYSERDKNAKVYELAHPYRIIIADFQNGFLTGIRHFYSPDAIVSWDEVLRLVNLPNTNTVGYRGVSLGWVCLYRNDDTTKMTLSEKVSYIINRESGLAEPYNDANMSNTDGTRFYQKLGKDPSFWDPTEWAKRTEAEGFDWICDENELVIAKIKLSDDPIARTYNEDGKPYTLRMASFDPYQAYYSDTVHDKPMNQWFTDRRNEIDPSYLQASIMSSLNQGAPAVAASKATPVDLDAQVNKFNFATWPKKTLNFFKDSIHCPSCKRDIMIGEITFQPVITNFTLWHRNNNSVTHTQVEEWCQDCLDLGAVAMAINSDTPSIHNPAYTYFSLNLLSYCASSEEWMFSRHVWTCWRCGENHSTLDNTLNDYQVLKYSEEPIDVSYIDGQGNTKTTTLPGQTVSHGCISCNEETLWHNETENYYTADSFTITEQVRASLKVDENGNLIIEPQTITRYTLGKETPPEVCVCGHLPLDPVQIAGCTVCVTCRHLDDDGRLQFSPIPYIVLQP
jgi:hypothetical protein